MLLFPRLGALSLDTIERVKYFGLRNVASCGICRKRQGRSATRRATRHDPEQIQTLYDLATSTSQMQGRRKRAREQLRRHGLDPNKRCRLPEVANQSLVSIDKFGPRLFGGLVRYERMHVYFIGYCTYAMDLIGQCVRTNQYKFTRRVVRGCHQFRDPVTGVTHPRLPYLLKMTHLTAERRVRAMFYWAHVLGLKAEVIREPVRLHVQHAVAHLQLILIATRGHRAYTSGELTTIFENCGRQFFRHLEAIASYLHGARFERQQRDHNRRPDRCPAPIPHERPVRYEQIISTRIHTILHVYKHIVYGYTYLHVYKHIVYTQISHVYTQFCTYTYKHIIYTISRVYTQFCTYTNPLYTCDFARREENESNTESTDDDLGWGGLGVFEYGTKGSAKGLVHALVHVRELVETGGHHGAFCTSLAEASHPQGIKHAAKFSRAYKSLNTTQDGMLQWVLRQILFSHVFLLHDQSQQEVRLGGEVSPELTIASRKFGVPLHYTDDWRELKLFHGVIRNDFCLPLLWRSTFLSKKVLISREEFLVLLRARLLIDETDANLQRIGKNLRIQCFGTFTTPIPDEPCKQRKLVGIDTTGRRDFVRIRGVENRTALGCQVRVYAPTCAYTHMLYTCILAHIRAKYPPTF